MCNLIVHTLACGEDGLFLINPASFLLTSHKKQNDLGICPEGNYKQEQICNNASPLTLLITLIELPIKNPPVPNSLS